jgi:hypothetical protein
VADEEKLQISTGDGEDWGERNEIRGKTGPAEEQEGTGGFSIQ